MMLTAQLPAVDCAPGPTPLSQDVLTPCPEESRASSGTTSDGQSGVAAVARAVLRLHSSAAARLGAVPLHFAALLGQYTAIFASKRRQLQEQQAFLQVRPACCPPNLAIATWQYFPFGAISYTTRSTCSASIFTNPCVFLILIGRPVQAV
jgi:hypothetical protein